MFPGAADLATFVQCRLGPAPLVVLQHVIEHPAPCVYAAACFFLLAYNTAL
jgi:hypothetical protein